jgi:hypothetical protein
MAEENIPAPPKPPWTLRLIHSFSQVATLVTIWWIATVGQLYGSTFRELSMIAVPAVTELAVKMSEVVLRPEVLVLGGLIGLALVLLGHFGFIDRALGTLIVVDLIVIAFVLVGWWVGLQRTMRQVHQQLSP